MSPRFTVITCTRNSIAWLSDAVQSVRSQSLTDFEHLFVDGHSTDGTLEFIRSLGGNYRLIEGAGGGIAAAMNVGIREARGAIVAHLHSDDYYANPDVLKHVAHAFDRSGAEWLFGRCLSDIAGQRVAENYLVPRFSYGRLLKGNFVPHPATFIKRSLFAKTGGFDESIKYAMDYDLWLKLAKITPPIQLDEHLAVFRRHPGSLTSSNQMASLVDDFAVRMRHATRTPWSMAYHWAHYLVRRKRLANFLTLQETSV